LGDHPEAEVYAEKSAEILPAMRFCSYKTGSGILSCHISRYYIICLLNNNKQQLVPFFLELKISDLSSEFQSAAIEAMIAQRPKMSEVVFRNIKITVPNEKIAAVLVKIEEFEKKTDKKVDMYEQILIDLRDAIQNVRDSSKLEQVK
jgi:RNA-binding signal recognition particle 68